MDWPTPRAISRIPPAQTNASRDHIRAGVVRPQPSDTLSISLEEAHEGP